MPEKLAGNPTLQLIIVEMRNQSPEPNAGCFTDSGLLRIAAYILCSIWSLFNASAQNPTLNFHHLTTRDGLSHDKVVSVFQDRDDFLWITTTDGLNRYDGKTFKTYYHADNDSNTIASNN